MTISSPLGAVRLSSDGGRLTGLRFVESEPSFEESAPDGCFDRVSSLLHRYWTGEQIHFDIPLDLAGTPFQTRVWRTLLEVPYGETITYAELARRIGAPRAVRAVGRANGANPIAIVVPCHRVVGSNGSLTGYGGGLDRKRRLLELESGVRQFAREPRRPRAPSARTGPA